MNKLTFAASTDSIPQLYDFIEAQFRQKPYAACNLEVMKQSSAEIVTAIAQAANNSYPITVELHINPSGTGAQFLHAGAIYNPCSAENEHCPYTTSHMDELSFEFKYGHNVLAIYKKLS